MGATPAEQLSSTEFAFVVPLVAPTSVFGAEVHVTTPEVMQLLFDGWIDYLGNATGLGRDVAFGGDAVPMTRTVSMEILREVNAGDALRLGVRAVSRSRRSFTLELALWLADGGLVATGSTVQVCVGGGGAVEVSPVLWSAIEQLEGREIPIDAPTAT